MTAQIIFPKQDTYWILSDGISYYDGLTPSNCVTTVGAGTTVYWIGSSHQQYVQECLNIGLVPRNPEENPLITIDPASPVAILDKKITDMNDKLVSLETVIPGERISATQARLWLIRNNFDLGLIDTVINGIEDENVRKTVQAQWEYSPYIERNNFWLNQIAQILNIDLNVVFTEAIDL